MNTLKVKLLFVTMMTVSTCFAQWSGGSTEVLTSGRAVIDRGTQSLPVNSALGSYQLNSSRADASLSGAFNTGGQFEGEVYQLNSVEGFMALDKLEVFQSSSGTGTVAANAGLFEMQYNGALNFGSVNPETPYVSGVKGVLSGSGNGVTNGAVSAVIGMDKIKGTNTLAGYFDGDVKIVNGTLDVENINFAVDHPPVFPNLELSSGALQLSGFNQQWTNSNWNVGITSPLHTAWVTTNNSNGDYMGIGMTGSGWYFIKGADAPGATSSNACIPFQVTLDGKTITREVEVTLSGWCDYVFDDDYSLRPLEEVEAFIAEHHHLPEVPSEAEVLEKGVNLGEMDAVLLKKIEELTLYILQQQKEIDALKAKVN